MAVTGKFQADFSSFVASAEKATLTLKTFESGGASVEKQLNRMGDSFTGRNLIRDATLAAEAIDRIGGTSKLTESELQRVASQASEAATKLRLMGQDVPPKLQALAEAVKPIPEQLTLAGRAAQFASGTFGQLFGAFTAANLVTNAVGSLKNWAAAAIEGASATVDLANKTGLSTETIQRMQYVAQQTGTTVDAFSEAAFRLGVRIDGGGGSVREAVDKLKLSFDTIKGLKADDQFAQIASALGTVEDATVRNRLAVDLFGKGAGQILSAITEGYGRLASQASVAGDAQVRAVDSAAEAWSNFLTKTEAGFTHFLGRAVQVGAGAAKAFTQGAGAGIGIEDLSGELSKALEAKDINLAHDIELTQSGTKATESYVAQLTAAAAAVDRLTPSTLAEIAAAKELGVSTQDLLDRFALTEAELVAVNKRLQEHQASLQKAATEAERIKAKQDEWNASIAEGDVRLLELATRVGVVTPAIQNMSGQIDASFPNFLELNDLIAKVPLALSAWPPALINASGTLVKAGDTMMQSFGHSFEQIGPTIQRALEGGGNVLKSLGSGFGADLTKHIFGGDAIKTSITTHLGSALGGAFNALLPGIGAIAGPLLDKLAGLFGGIFGGPSAKEKAGRSASDAFTDSLKSSLDWQKQIEVHQLVAAGGSEKWATQVVAIQQAYAKSGHTAAEVEQDVTRLWEAEKQGGGAVQTVIDEIIAKMHDLGAAADPDIAALADLTDSFSGKEMLHQAELAVQAVEAIGGVSHLTEAEQQRLNAQLTEAINKYHALGQEAPEAMLALKAATDKAGDSMNDLLKEINKVNKSLGTGNVSQSDLEAWLLANPGDIGRAQEALTNITDPELRRRLGLPPRSNNALTNALSGGATARVLAFNGPRAGVSSTEPILAAINDALRQLNGTMQRQPYMWRDAPALRVVRP